MSKSILRLTIAATDEYHQLVRGQQIIRLCLEEDITSEEGRDTVMVLLECYQGWLSLHLDELRTRLENLLLEVQRLEGEQ